MLKSFSSRLVFCLASLVSLGCGASALDALSGQDAGRGLQQALTQGAERAVSLLGRQDGFLGNPKVRIPLPGALQKAEGLMRKFGMGSAADELETSMNRAAEAAVPQAKALLVQAVQHMSVQDAKAILSGGDDAATQYFRRTTSAPLAEQFKPVVQKAMAHVKLAEKYDQFAGKGVKFGLVKDQDAHMDNYVTQKTLDGLYAMMAEEEKAMRKDPVRAAGSLAQKVFGLLK
jgi:hypothetical protein